MRNHRLAIIAAIILAAVASFLAMPVRYQVDGLSMGPSLLPGDIIATGWCARLNRAAEPQRLERWIVTLPDGSTGLKRLIGLPGETVSLVDGDLTINGQRVLKMPSQLAEVGSVVTDVDNTDAAWIRPAGRILDDAPFAPDEVSRLLLPVRDGGFAAEVTVPPTAFDEQKRVWARGIAGPLKVTWRIKAAGRYAIVAGRLDGHAVAAAWPLSPESDTTPSRRCLPACPPDVWDVTRPWPDTDPNDEAAAHLFFSIFIGEFGAPMIDRIVTWRDILYRPTADGVMQWSLDADQIFLLGDFPSGSRDSRHFGPLPTTSLRHGIP